MKNKIVLGFSSVWTAIMAFLAPLCIGLIYMDITGHSKGYAYDLGAEKSVSVFMGFVGLVIWLMISVPSFVYVLKELKKRRTVYCLGAVLACLVLASIFIFGIIGWNEYIKIFGIGI